MTGIWWTTVDMHGAVYLYRNGALVYKRWLNGMSMLAGAVPSFPYWHRRAG